MLLSFLCSKTYNFCLKLYTIIYNILAKIYIRWF
nr:MAG TPA: hypothetical protein [Caudoviricetes sp.]